MNAIMTFILYIFIFQLSLIEIICEKYDNTKNSIIEVPPSDIEDSIKQNGHVLTEPEADDIQNQEQQLPDLSDDKSLSIQFTIPDKVEKSQEITEVPLQYLPAYVDDMDLFERKNIFDNPFLHSPYSGLPFTLGQVLRPIKNIASYEMDTLGVNPNMFNLIDENSYVNLYLVRKKRSDEDILEQLEHDAIIHNILPTMDPPFFRDASYYNQANNQLPIQGSEPVMAYFPTPYGAPIPILLGCSPKITQGYRQNMQMPLPYYNHEAYWQEPVIADNYKK